MGEVGMEPSCDKVVESLRLSPPLRFWNAWPPLDERVTSIGSGRPGAFPAGSSGFRVNIGVLVLPLAPSEKGSE